MPKLMNQPPTVVGSTISNFGYSGKKIADLTATEYTLVNIAVDVSPSTSPFLSDLENALKVVVDTLNKSPNSEKLLVRVQEFDRNLSEVHGFITLKDIKAEDYTLKGSAGGTSLYDAILGGLEAISSYGTDLDNMDFGVNGVMFIITDGEDNYSTKGSPHKIKQAISQIAKDEALESLKIILIGVGQEARTKIYLEELQKTANIDQYIWVGNLTVSQLAKLAEFISKSISAASLSLNSAGPSQNLDF